MTKPSKASCVVYPALAAALALAVSTSVAHASVATTSYTENTESFQAVYAFTPDIVPTDGESHLLGDWAAVLNQTNTLGLFTFAWAGAHLATPHAGELPLLLADLGTCTLNNITSLTGTFCDTTTTVTHLSLPDYDHNDVYHFWLDLTNGSGYAYFTGEHVVVSAVPLPAAVWMFGSGLVGMATIGRRNRILARK